MARIKRLAPHRHRPQDARILVGRHDDPISQCAHQLKEKSDGRRRWWRWCAFIPADLAPWINSLRKYMPKLFLPLLKFYLFINPGEISIWRPFLNTVVGLVAEHTGLLKHSET